MKRASRAQIPALNRMGSIEGSSNNTPLGSRGDIRHAESESSLSRIGTVSHSPATDINNDGRMDLWVSNDTVADFLFVNRGKGKFEEIGETAGVAYSESGRVRSGMGPLPGGELERITDLPIDRYITIVEGTGKWR